MIRKGKSRFIRHAGILSGAPDGAYALVIVVASVLAPAIAARAAEGQAATTAPSSHNGNFGDHVKRDATAVGIAFKETGRRIGVAAKAVAHEIATAAKRGAAETRTAMRGERVDSTASSPIH